MDGTQQPNWQTATILNHFNLASTFHYFICEVAKTLIYKPGQYLSVKVAPDRINDYSIAGSDEPSKFSLLVNSAPGGPGSKFFENLKNNDQILYLGPMGTFTFRENDGANRILFLATGAGLAPIKAILDDILPKKHIKIPVALYLGLTSVQDIFFDDYFKILKQQYPNFNYKIVIWKPDENWHGASGFITDEMQKDFTDLKDAVAYLCGNPVMIENATKILLEKGIVKEKIYTEKQ